MEGVAATRLVGVIYRGWEGGSGSMVPSQLTSEMPATVRTRPSWRNGWGKAGRLKGVHGCEGGGGGGTHLRGSEVSCLQI